MSESVAEPLAGIPSLAAYVAEIPAAIEILTYAFAMLLVTWPFFLLLEKMAPVIPDTPRANYWLNWKITFSNFLITPVFYALAIFLTTALADAAGLPGFGYPLLEISVGLPFLDTLIQAAVLIFTACFLGDVWYYWWHRMQHEIPALWEMHKLHHSDENLNATTIYRSHFLELAGQALVRGLTIGLVFDLTATPETLVAIIAAGLFPTIWDIFIHANVRMDFLHKLVPFFSTPQYHWIHHSKLPQHKDKNYAIWLPLFDVIFGTYYRSKVDEYPPTGLSTGEKIETVWDGQVRPLAAWAAMLKKRRRVVPD